jgi:hypothetical protein
VRETKILLASVAIGGRVGLTPARAGRPARALAVLGVGRKIVVTGMRDAWVATIAFQRPGRGGVTPLDDLVVVEQIDAPPAGRTLQGDQPGPRVSPCAVERADLWDVRRL